MGDDNRSDLIKKRTDEAKRTLPDIRATAQEDEEEDRFERDPMKMYVRKKAWLEIIQRYQRKRMATGVGPEFKYFTLPGRRGIDIGVLWKEGLLKKKDGKWSTVAICDSKHVASVTSRLGLFEASSPQRLEEILDKPNDPLVRFFPVDVINLDFCDAVLKGNSERKTLTNLETIKKLIYLQQGRSESFLILLTHRLGKNEYSGQVKDLMTEKIEHNLNDNEGFRTRFLETYDTVDVGSFSANLLEFSLLGIAKFIAQLAQEHGCRISEQFVGYYRRNGYFMGINSFEIEPLHHKPKYTPARFTRSPVSTTLLNLPDKVKKQAIESYSEFIAKLPGRPLLDVNANLESDPSLLKKYTDMGNAYMEWWKQLDD